MKKLNIVEITHFKQAEFSEFEIEHDEYEGVTWIDCEFNYIGEIPTELLPKIVNKKLIHWKQVVCRISVNLSIAFEKDVTSVYKFTSKPLIRILKSTTDIKEEELQEILENWFRYDLKLKFQKFE